MAWNQKQLTKVLAEQEAWLLAQSGVVGTGIALGKQQDVCIQIHTHSMAPSTRRLIEDRLRGLPLEFSETGPISAQPD